MVTLYGTGNLTRGSTTSNNQSMDRYDLTRLLYGREHMNSISTLHIVWRGVAPKQTVEATTQVLYLGEGG